MGAATYSFRATASFTEHDKAVDKARAKVKDYKKEVDSARASTEKLSKQNFSGAYQSQAKLQRTVKTTTTLMDGLSGNMMGAIGKFGPYAAAAVAAFKMVETAVNKAKSVNETFSDQMDVMTSKINGAWNEFINRLTRWDWSNFLSGMSQAVLYSGQLTAALDRQGTYNLTSDPDLASVNNTITTYRIEIQKLTNEVRRLKKEQGNKVDTSQQVAAIERYNNAIDEEIKKLEQIQKIRVRNAKDVALSQAALMGINQQAVNDLYSHPGVNVGNMNAALGFMSGNRNSRVDVGAIMSFMYDDLESPMLNSLQKTFRRMLEAWGEGNKALADKIGQDSFGIANAASGAPDTMDALWNWMRAVQSRMTEGGNGALDTYIKARNDAENAVAAILQARQQHVTDQGAQIRAMTTGGGGGGYTPPKVTFQQGSIAELDDQIKKLQDRLENEKFDIKVQLDVQNQIQELENKKAMMELQLSLAGDTDITSAFGSLLDGVLQSDTPEKFCEELVGLIDNILQAQPGLQLPPFILPNEEMEDAAKEAMSNIDAIIEEEYQKIIKGIHKRNTEMADSFGYIGDAFDSLGYMISSFGGDANDAAGKMVSGFANVISIAGQTIAKLTAMAAAEGVSSALELPFPANIGAISTILAAVMSAVGTIASLANASYATGGIVDSALKHGDRNLVRVNGGEMILNNQQQTRLFRMLNGIQVPDGTTGGGQVQFRISGGDLVGVLKNYDTVNKRIR